ncbi:hypothetical protein VTK56DRAFT_7419 [Thermocarpiscus australiensis]
MNRSHTAYTRGQGGGWGGRARYHHGNGNGNYNNSNFNSNNNSSSSSGGGGGHRNRGNNGKYWNQQNGNGNKGNNGRNQNQNRNGNAQGNGTNGNNRRWKSMEQSLTEYVVELFVEGDLTPQRVKELVSAAAAVLEILWEKREARGMSPPEIVRDLNLSWKACMILGKLSQEVTGIAMAPDVDGDIPMLDADGRLLNGLDPSSLSRSLVNSQNFNGPHFNNVPNQNGPNTEPPELDLWRLLKERIQGPSTDGRFHY